MRAWKDGPGSKLFQPLVFEGNASLNSLNNHHFSTGLMDASILAPEGECVAWGIPFQVKNCLILEDRTLTIKVDPFMAPWIIFMHTMDQNPLLFNKDGFINPMKGEGRLGERGATYTICFEDGSETKKDIICRRQIGAFQRRWGENCFEAVAAVKPHPVRAAHEQTQAGWGRTQTRVESSDYRDWVNWLWAWQNPYPEKIVIGFRFEPGDRPVIISAISTGNVSSHPLRWNSRKKARLVLPDGIKFIPELDENGQLSQIQMDMGQIISAQSRNRYPESDWESTYNNQLPQLADNDVLVEYTCHPQACFYFHNEQVIQAQQLEQEHQSGPLFDVKKVEKPVNLRVVDRLTGKILPVKLHVHGESGEYLAPVDRHRIINSAWFEDYSVDFTHITYNQSALTHPCTYISGDTWLTLPLGKVYIEISKGFEIRPIRVVYEITPSTELIQIEIEKVLPWRERGWVTADTHVHFLSPVSAILEGSAEGVNVINLLASQWGELMTNVGDFDGRNTWGSKEAGGDGEFLVRVGTENRQHVLGHISLLGYGGPIIAPMTTGGADESAIGDPINVLLTEWARQCHAQGGLVVLPHFPNPRAEHAATIVSGEIDGLEMTSWENLYGGIDPYSLSDWYRYLNCGYLVPVVGGTDKMSPATAVGTVRTYAWLDPRTEFSYETWKEAVKHGDTFVTYGPLLEFNVEGHSMGSRFMLGSNGGAVQVSWQAASVTVPMTRIELIINGEVKESLPIAKSQESGYWSVKIEKSCWLALLVRGHYPDQPEIIAAHSSPVMVQVAGSPLISAPDAVTILDQIEGSLAYLDTVGTRAEDVTYKRMRMVLDSAYRRLHERLHQSGYYHDHTPINDHS